MKALLITASLLLAVISPAAAQTATATGNANSSSQSGAIAIGGSGSARATGGNSSIIFNSPGSTRSDTRIRQSGSLRTTPSVGGVGLGAAGVETCFGPGMGGGLAVTGFGANFAVATFDHDCNARLYSRTLFAMGYKRQSIQLLVNESPIVARAFGVGQEGAPVAYSGRQGARSAAGGCSKWAGGNIGGQCLY